MDCPPANAWASSALSVGGRAGSPTRNIRGELTCVISINCDMRVGTIAGSAAGQVTGQTSEIHGAVHGISQRLPPDLNGTIRIHQSHVLDSGPDQHEGIVRMGMEHADRLCAKFCEVGWQKMICVFRAKFCEIGTGVTKKPSTFPPVAFPTSGVHRPSAPIK